MMKKMHHASLILFFATTTVHAQFGGLFGGKKNSAGTDNDAYLAKGIQLVQGYAKIQAAVLEVGAAQALAEKDIAKAEVYTARANALKQDPSSENFEKAAQSIKEITEKQKNEEKRSVEYSEKGKEALQATAPKSVLTLAASIGLGIEAVAWLKEYPDQLKAAGFLDKAKLIKSAKIPLTVAKQLPESLVTILKTLNAIFAYSKKQGVDLEAADKELNKIENNILELNAKLD